MMITRFVSVLIAAIGFFWATPSLAANASPAGFWETLDVDDGKPRSIIQVTENNGVLTGVVVKNFPRDGESATPICKNCEDDLHNKPIIGMTVLWDAKKSKDGWKDGQILAPKRGRIYPCDISMPDDNTLQVDVYVVVLTKTQLWKRVADPNASK